NRQILRARAGGRSGQAAVRSLHPRNCATVFLSGDCRGDRDKAELDAVMSIGIPLGQGFYLSRPAGMPVHTLAQPVRDEISNMSAARARILSTSSRKPTARSILRTVPVVEHSTRTNDVYR